MDGVGKEEEGWGERRKGEGAGRDKQNREMSKKQLRKGTRRLESYKGEREEQTGRSKGKQIQQMEEKKVKRRKVNW